MTAKIIDFRTGLTREAPQDPATLKAPDGPPKWIVEFFDDPAFPMRFKGLEPEPNFMRGAARELVTTAIALLHIAYNKDGDASQLPQLVAYLFHDGSVVVDGPYDPRGSGAIDARGFEAALRKVPQIYRAIREKEQACTPTSSPIK